MHSSFPKHAHTHARTDVPEILLCTIRYKIIEGEIFVRRFRNLSFLHTFACVLLGEYFMLGRNSQMENENTFEIVMAADSYYDDNERQPKYVTAGQSYQAQTLQ